MPTGTTELHYKYITRYALGTLLFTEYHYFDDETDGMPIITLEVMPDASIAETVPYDSFFPDTQPNNAIEAMKDPKDMPFLMEKNDDSTGMHFLVDKSETEMSEQSTDHDANSGSLNVRTDLMEYTTRSDGSVCCKVCGKVLASRSHWYRHKYRAHMMNSVNPAPLFQCEQCLIYFKSRKGYIGHIASKHSETLQDASPVLTNAQAEALAKEKSIIQPHSIKQLPVESEPIQLDAINLDLPKPDLMQAEVKKEPDPELSIPKSIVPTFQSVTSKPTTTKNTEAQRKITRSMRHTSGGTMHRNPDVVDHVENENEWQERRSREEKLVADIIARVRRECEAQGSGGSARRGYSRKSALHT